MNFGPTLEKVHPRWSGSTGTNKTSDGAARTDTAPKSVSGKTFSGQMWIFSSSVRTLTRKPVLGSEKGFKPKELCKELTHTSR